LAIAIESWYEDSYSDASWMIVRSTEGGWEAAGVAGMRCKCLFCDAETGRYTALVRMGSGVHYPPHRHTDTEELYLLEGDLTVEGQVLRAGDYCAAIAGSIYGRSQSKDGCTFIYTGAEPEEVPEPSDSTGSQGRQRFWRRLATLDVIDAQSSGDMVRAYSALRHAAGHMAMIANLLADAIVKQFPAKYSI
jgi:hypothetical protein